MACADVATAKAKAAIAINLNIVFLPYEPSRRDFLEEWINQQNLASQPQRWGVGTLEIRLHALPEGIPALSGPHLRLDGGTTDENDVGCN
jgi:hypothetical protein